MALSGLNDRVAQGSILFVQIAKNGVSSVRAGEATGVTANPVEREGEGEGVFHERGQSQNTSQNDCRC
jgi:hypothetical protein